MNIEEKQKIKDAIILLENNLEIAALGMLNTLNLDDG